MGPLLSSSSRLLPGEPDGLFSAKPTTPFSLEISEIVRLIPIVVETEQILNRGNSLLKSRAQVSNGSSSLSDLTRRGIVR